MSLSEIFPAYPVQIVSPRKSNIKIASRKVFVDFPYIFWNFIADITLKMDKSKFPQEVFKKELELFTSDEEIKKIATFNNVPLGKVLLLTSPFTTKLLLKLKVNWQTFFEYLEDKAQKLISKVEEDGSNIRNVYFEIIDNYFKLVPFVPNPELSRFNINMLENFKKLLRRQGEEQNIQLSLSILQQIVRSIEKTKNVEGIKLWAMQFESDIYGIKKCLENMDILSCYFYLRNMLENLIKLIVYNDIAKDFIFYDEMLQIFFFYEKIAGNRCYSIHQLKDKYVKKIASHIRGVNEINLEEIYLMMIEKRLPKLCINNQTLEEFQKKFNIHAPIKNYWSACSEVIHNQSPLPFFSLLEVKSFKHFLKKYIECFASVIRIVESCNKVPSLEDIQICYAKAWNALFISKELQGGKAKYELETKQKLNKKARKVLRHLLLQKEKEIENILESLVKNKDLKRKEIFFNPSTLASLFYLISPSITHITSGEFNIDDVQYFIVKVQPLSFNVSLEFEFYKTLKMLEEEIMPKLEKVSSEFSELNEEEKKSITFYLLAMKLPELCIYQY